MIKADKILISLWVITGFFTLCGAAALIGIIDVPPQTKYYYTNKESVQVVKERLKDISNNYKYERETDNRQRIIEVNHHDSLYMHWPLDKDIFMEVCINKNKKEIGLSSYFIGGIEIKTIGKINRFDYEGSSLIKQILIIRLFEKKILHDLPYHSDTNFIQDCYNYMKRPFVELCAFLCLPFILLTIFSPFILIYHSIHKEDNE